MRRRFRNPRLWIGFASAGIVFTIAIVDLGRTSPGPLAKVHAREGMSCAQCHGGWFGNMTDSCVKCHERIGEQIEQRDGLHGAISDAGDCAKCHTEHHGDDFVMVNRQSFAQAGVSNPEVFDHKLVGFAMDGEHLEQDCAKCHEHAHDAVLPKGETRFLGLDQNCATCHEDAHDGRMALACAACHGQQSFDELHSAGHERFLPLFGAHADVSCRKCHAPDATHSLETLGRGTPVDARTCVSCHETPHRAPSMNRKGSCIACHGPEMLQFEHATITPEQHADAGFRLDAPHDEVSCDRCHKTETGNTYPGRVQDDCAACHSDPHAGQFERQTCLDCHDRHRFEPHAFTQKMHAAAGFVLDGKHGEADCHACHKQSRKGVARTFAGTPGTCVQCHQTAHDGFFQKESCSLCHTTHTFETAKSFEHTLTGFRVEGAHAQANCEACHTRTKKPDHLGRDFGRIVDFQGCATCHTDPHRGEFKADCATCHQQTSFRAFPRGFDHKRWTGFPLDGAHKRVDCAACHKPQRKPDVFGRTWKRAKGARCAACHTDPHAGQFRKNCESCHKGADKFAALNFQHNRDARFKLDKTHAKVSCDACHKPFRGVVRYRPLGRKCGDCHRAQRDPLRRKR